MSYHLVAEGKANKVLRTPSNALIRVSKRGEQPAEVAAYWNDFWRPKLGKYMGRMTPIDDPEVGPCLLLDEIGTGDSKIVAEFKPKWLHQSPEAPAQARMCRTCAIKTMRGQENSWCSLDVAAKDTEAVRRCMQSVALPQHADKCAQLLLSTDLLDKLTYWQSQLANPTGFLDCMSLRDCTVMVEYLPGAESEYRCWLVDLDPKGGPDKIQKWKQIEDRLRPYYLSFNPTCRLSRISS